MLIGKLALKSGFSKDTIRYYEKIGFIQASGYVRQANNYKSYSDQTLERLLQIQKLKCAGFTLAEITDMLDSFDGSSNPCTGLPRNLAEKISTINAKIKLLESYKLSIQKIANACDSQCALDNGLPSCIRA